MQLLSFTNTTRMRSKHSGGKLDRGPIRIKSKTKGDYEGKRKMAETKAYLFIFSSFRYFDPSKCTMLSVPVFETHGPHSIMTIDRGSVSLTLFLKHFGGTCGHEPAELSPFRRWHPVLLKKNKI